MRGVSLPSRSRDQRDPRLIEGRRRHHRSSRRGFRQLAHYDTYIARNLENEPSSKTSTLPWARRAALLITMPIAGDYALARQLVRSISSMANGPRLQRPDYAFRITTRPRHSLMPGHLALDRVNLVVPEDDQPLPLQDIFRWTDLRGTNNIQGRGIDPRQRAASGRLDRRAARARQLTLSALASLGSPNAGRIRPH